MKRPKLSIIITFCNQKKYIADILDSIFMQKTIYDYEIIIGLDGICKESENIINNYITTKHNILFYKLSSPNNLIPLAKASVNRYALSRHASGEYITFMDGDDFYIDKNRFQKMISILENRYEYIGIAHSYKLYDDINKTFISTNTAYKAQTILHKDDLLAENKYIFSNTIIFRNIFLYSNIFYPDTFYLNDTTLTTWILQYGKILFLPDPMLGYRCNIDSIYSGKKPIEKRINELIICEENYKIFPVYKHHYHNKIKQIVTDIASFRYSYNLYMYYNYVKDRGLHITQNAILYIGSTGEKRLINKSKLYEACLLL